MRKTAELSDDYRNRTYMSATESAKYLGITVDELHKLVDGRAITASMSASGQMRFSLVALKHYESKVPLKPVSLHSVPRVTSIHAGETVQRVVRGDSRKMRELPDGSVNLMITSPPYFDAKMYSRESVKGDLGGIHDVNEWFSSITAVWREVYRVLQPGRKAFINIMNLPVRLEEGGFKSLNLVGKTVDVLEQIGFVFKRDIIWHKTNSVRAHFGTYPYPGGILINNSHESILEFEKPAPAGYRKYAHLTSGQKEASKLDRDFWLSLKNSDVWSMHPEGSGDRRSHVAPFPFELPHRLIKAYSYIGETVLDPFLGSGTTLVAAAKLRRNGIGYELMGDIASLAVESVKKAVV